MTKSKFYHQNQKGFSMVEMLVYLAILSLVALLVSSVVAYFVNANKQSKGDRQVLENARRAVEEISYEIAASQGIYTPTTTQTQLSLETTKYLPSGETTSYIDFFICDNRICLKKDGQSPIYITDDAVVVNSLTFTRVVNNNSPSVKIDLTINYKNATGTAVPSVNFTSTASLRNN